MAYGIIKETKFNDNQNGRFVLRIWQKNYSGSISTFNCGSEGFELKYKGEGDDVDSPFKMSECTFTFFSENSGDDQFVLDMIGADESDYLLDIVYDHDNNGTFQNFWKGVIIVDSAELGDLYYPQPFKIHAIDGISLLKAKPVTDLTNIYNVAGSPGGSIGDFDVFDVGSPSWDGETYQHRSLLLACLRLIPTTDLFGTTSTFNYNLSCWENDKMASLQNDIKQDPLRSSASASSVFYSESNDGNFSFNSCFDMLKDILEFYNMRLFMMDGYWVTIQLGTYEQMKTANEFYVRYRKTDYGISQAGNGSLTYNIGDLDDINDQANIYQIAESTFSYSKQIKEIEIDIDKDNGMLFQQSYDWATNTNYTITQDPNPSEANYINTNIGGNVGENFTFQFRVKTRVTRDAQGLATYNPNYQYFAKIFYKIKIDNYYLYWDPQSLRYKWSTTEQPVKQYANSSFLIIPDYNASNNEYYSLFNNLGSSSPDIMDPIPVTGPIQIYIYHKMYIGINGVHVGISSTNYGVTFTTNRNLEQYGGDSRAIELDLFKNNEAFNFSQYLIQNKPNNQLVEGGVKLKRDSKFASGSGTIRQNTIFTWDGSANALILVGWAYDYQARWRNRNLASAVQTLPSLKGIEMIALQPSNKKLLRCTLYHKTGVTNRIFKFRDMFKYLGDYYIPNGYTFNANDGSVVGEFMIINYDLDNASPINVLNSNYTGNNNGDLEYEGGPNEGLSNVF